MWCESTVTGRSRDRIHSNGLARKHPMKESAVEVRTETLAVVVVVLLLHKARR